MIRDSYGLVLCGGRSTRMKADKSFLTYSDQPQWRRVYQMLGEHCSKVFISCNDRQVDQFAADCPVIVDQGEFKNNGPIAALLSAFQKYPDQDWVIVGCDYPLLSSRILNEFAKSPRPIEMACTFFNESENVYEPVIGWYSHRCRLPLMERFAAGKYSLQNFLRTINARKHIPSDINALMSIDTPALMVEAMAQLKLRTYADDSK